MQEKVGVQFRDETLEREAHEAIAVTEAGELLHRFSTLVRDSGSADERAAGRYIVERLHALGVPVTVHDPELYHQHAGTIRGSASRDGGTRLARSRPVHPRSRARREATT